MKNDDEKLVDLVREGREELWTSQADFNPYYGEVGAPAPPAEHLADIKRAGGELVVCVSGGQVLGWIGLKPDFAKGEAELAGIGVHTLHRNRGIAVRLMDRAAEILGAWGIDRLVFQTSALFTSNAALYLRHCGAECAWNGTNYVDKENDIPWPLFDCVIRVPFRKRDSGPPAGTDGGKAGNAEAGEAAPILTWRGMEPKIDTAPLERGAQRIGITIPYYDMKKIWRDLQDKNPAVLRAVRDAFERATAAGYAARNFVALCGDMFMYILEKPCNG